MKRSLDGLGYLLDYLREEVFVHKLLARPRAWEAGPLSQELSSPILAIHSYPGDMHVKDPVGLSTHNLRTF